MKTKNILLIIFSLLTFATYSQTEKNDSIKAKSVVKEFKVKFKNFDEFKNFDWNKLKKVFKDNHKYQKISLYFSYVNTSKVDNTITKDDYTLKMSGLTFDLKNLITEVKNDFEKHFGLIEKSKN